MNILDLLGAIALGTFVGFIIRFFIERFENFSAKGASAILGTALGGVAITFLLNFGPHRFPAYTVGLVLGLILYQFLYSQFPKLPLRKSSTGPLVALEVQNRLTVHDREGEKATWYRWEKVRFNREVVELLITQISLDGGVDGVPQLTTSRPGSLFSKVKAGQISYYVRYNNPAKKGDLDEIGLTINFKGSFKDSNESFQHTLLDETERLEFEIHFPADRVCHKVDLVKAFGSQSELVASLTPASVVRRTVEKSMRVQEAYHIEWSW